jgi:polyferredoxin
LTVIIVTAILGRVFCGWICPLGTLHHLAGKLKKGTVPVKISGLYRIKYLLLNFILVLAFGGASWRGGDPLALLIRSLSLAVYPMFSYALGCFFDGVFAGNIPFITVSSEIICGFLKRTVLPFGQPFFLEGISIGLIFFLTLALNLREKRFWCKYLCPLEALLRMPFPSDLPGNRPLPPAILASGASSARCWQA